MSETDPYLPRYVRSHWSEPEQRYYFRWEVAARDAKAGFPVPTRSLGTDRRNAIEVAERELLPMLETWRERRQASGTGGELVLEPVSAFLSMDWLVAEYHKTDVFDAMKLCSQEDARKLLRRALDHVFRDGRFAGRRFGSLQISEVKFAVADRLYGEMRNDPVRGVLVRTPRNAMRWLNQMWNVMIRAEEDVMPALKPFSGMKLRNESTATEKATFENLLAFDAAAHELEFPNVATTVLAAWELLIRVESIPTQLRVEDWRPPHRPDDVRIIHYKTSVRTWAPLFEDGEPLYPMLIERLDQLKGDRTSGILIPKDGTVDQAWAAAPPPTGSLTSFYKVFRQIANKAGLPREIKFTSFRHGGVQEGADAGLTQAEHMTDTGHLDVRTLQSYWSASPTIRVHARKKRLLHRYDKLSRSRRTRGKTINAIQTTHVREKRLTGPKE